MISQDSKTTMAEEWCKLMQAPTYRFPVCAVCGRPQPLNQHHIVRRSAGEYYCHGKKMPKPTLTLCGLGNYLADDWGRYYCHGLAHHEMLHFLYVPEKRSQNPSVGKDAKALGGHLEYLRTEKPTKYIEALKMDGWKRIGVNHHV